MNQLTDSSLLKKSLWPRHAQTVGDGAFSHKIDYIRRIFVVLNLQGHTNWIICSRVRAIFLNWWILPVGGVATGRVWIKPSHSYTVIHTLSIQRTLTYSVQPSDSWTYTVQSSDSIHTLFDHYTVGYTLSDHWKVGYTLFNLRYYTFFNCQTFEQNTA